MQWIIDRLGEPSTYRGLFGLLAAAGIAIHPEQAEAITAFALAAIGLINVFRKENK